MRSTVASLLGLALFGTASAQTACVSDGNGDGTVDVTDLLGLLGQFGGGGTYDTDGNGIVDVTDLLALLGEYGTTDCSSGGSGEWTVANEACRGLDPDENNAVSPHEWRSFNGHAVTLEQCKAICVDNADTCTGIEFRDLTDDGSATDCIMMGAPLPVEVCCTESTCGHGANPNNGWTVYARPSGGASGLASIAVASFEGTGAPCTYYLVDQDATFRQATDTCIGAGGQPASVHSTADAEAMWANMLEASPAGGTNTEKGAWIGYHDMHAEGCAAGCAGRPMRHRVPGLRLHLDRRLPVRLRVLEQRRAERLDYRHPRSRRTG